MPIYAYKCESCGHGQDILQKMSDPVLSLCPACGASAFVKQVTAAGFQLKGSGWYATDFKQSGQSPAPKSESTAPDAAPAKPAATPSAPAPAPATTTSSSGGSSGTSAPGTTAG